MLAVSGITKTYGAAAVLEGVSLQLSPGEKAGLIGPNGCGKTTLLKIIAGELEADAGNVVLSRGTVTGYLPQEPPALQDITLRDYLILSLGPLLEMKEQIASLELEMGRCSPGDPRLPGLLQRYGELAHTFEERGGYGVESRLAAVARGLGFAPEELESRLGSFSGGEKTRARLAALLLEEPDLLLLDEPTNFLDQEGLEWLERYLKEWRRSLLVVSHDRYFLDRVAGRIFLMEGRSLKSYRGNYSSFLEQRRQEEETLEKAYRKQQAVIAREEKFIREAKGDKRSQRQAASRQKHLARMDRVERPAEGKSFRLGLEYAGRGGRLVVSFDRVGKTYGPKAIFSDLSFEIRWGDRIALVGPNGAGKSTLLRLMAGEIEPTRGEIRLGPAVKAAYFAQEQEHLVSGRTLLEEIMDSCGLDNGEARGLLGRYLFRGEDVLKKVEELSGGEKSRLALARLSQEEGNLLLMDEPTSHLDLPALEKLEEALCGYPGTLVVVSHDRFFLSGLANRVLEIRNGTMRSFDGDFAAYLDTRSREDNGGREGHTVEKPARQDLRRQQEAGRQEQLQERRRLRKLLQEQAGLEEAVAEAEEAVKAAESALADPALYGEDYTRVQELHRRLKDEQARAAGLLERWERVSLELASLTQPD